MKAGSLAWWGGKVRQARRHLFASVGPAERGALAGWLTPAELALFNSMHIADQRHGLDVVAWLRTRDEGTDRAADPGDRDLLVAGLLHDAGKGWTGFVPRVAYSLGQAYGPSVARFMGWWPGMTRDLERLRTHAETSATLAKAVGCSPRTVELIRRQEDPTGDAAGERLRLADEAS
jgi:hypothetical protein